jgi:PilZ domain
VTQLLQTEAHGRSPRLQFVHTTPAVLRFQNGSRIRGKLQVISVTGGLLSLSNPLEQGSRVKLMFLTDTGTVFGTAEMLPSISSTQQPFRFVTIDENHERRLRDVIQSSVDQNRSEQQSIVKDRAW